MMPHVYGEEWNEKEICESVLDVTKVLCRNTMPTHNEMNRVYGNKSLSCAVSKHGGTNYFANLLGLEIKKCESEFGDKYELYCANQIKDILGLGTRKMKPRYPYDILVDDAVKVDVKCATLYVSSSNTRFYTFNIEKKNPTCDVYVCYCLNGDKEILKTLIIPSSVMSGKKQLSVGFSSAYDKYKDAWEIISDFSNFFKKYSS